MTAGSAAKLYTPRLLALSTGLANYPLDQDFALTHEARSRTCGSSIKLGLDIDGSDRISRIGMQVSACAIGQSSAAIFAQQATGQGTGTVIDTVADIEAWLNGVRPLPDWPDFDALEPARDHAGRHGALLLVWTAARAALSSPDASG